jgi:hypothetical protein
MSSRKKSVPAKKTGKKALGKAKSEKLPSTIGDNPLDLLVPAAPVKQVTASRPRAAVAPGTEPTTVLTITVPHSLASQVEHILAVSPELSFDQLMSTALAEVLQSIKGRHRGKKMASSVKELATSIIRR